ncbi:hypothetical protein [Sphingobacterium sp. NPDC055431]
MSVKFRDPSFVRTTGRGKPKVKNLYANAIRNLIMSVKFRDPSFVRTTGRGKPKVQESTPIHS